MSILIPGIQTARKKAASIACLNNLRQTGMIFAEYENIYDGIYPLSCSNSYWLEGLYQVLRYDRKKMTFYCPATKPPRYSYVYTYGRFNATFGEPFQKKFGGEKNFIYYSSGGKSWYDIRRMKNLSSYIYLSCSVNGAVIPGDRPRIGLPFYSMNPKSGGKGGMFLVHPGDCCGSLYMDGHASMQSLSALQYYFKDAAYCRGASDSILRNQTAEFIPF